MTKNAIVIVGAGQGGFQTAASLRMEGFEGEIVLIGAEPGLPYQRPPLSKAYFTDANADRLLFRKEDYFEKNRITLLSSTRVSRIQREQKLVETEDGRSFPYDHLVLATGTNPRKLPIPGTDLGNVLHLHTLADADRLRALAEKASNAVMIGGGFIGLEAGSVLRRHGLEVSIVELEPRVMARAVSEAVSAHFEKLHKASGVKLCLGKSVASLSGNEDGDVKMVTLSDGTELAGDLVLICAGVVPEVKIAAETGLEIENGIRVDQYLVTSDPSISAIGDCASFVHQTSGQRIRLESVQNAVDQAKCVASNILGEPEIYDRVAWFWSDQGDAKLQIAGLCEGADQWHSAPSENPEKLTVLAFRCGLFVGAETINNGSDHMFARKLLGLETGVSYQDFERGDFDLRTVMKNKS